MSDAVDRVATTRDPELESRGSSSESDSEANSNSQQQQWIPLSERPEWRDVQPLPQDDGDYHVAQINYSAKFVEVHDYLRAVYAKHEASQRSLALTAEALQLNPANYTVWEYRRHILFTLDSDLTAELQFTRQIIEDNPKNYQVWQHRRVLVTKLKSVDDELRFTEVVLAADAKNYHVWQHRQWLVTHFSAYTSEGELIERLLLDDVRNNSAWNHRYFILTHDPNNRNDSGKVKSDLLVDELDFALAKLHVVKGNESVWSYIRGLSDLTDDPPLTLQIRTAVSEFCNTALQKRDEMAPSVLRHVLGAIVDVLVDEVEEATESKNGDSVVIESNLHRLSAICDDLANNVDPIRKKYWTFVKDSTLKSTRRLTCQ